jgi:hypothetical protein
VSETAPRPGRIQKKRGVPLPPGVIDVARPTIWGNPFEVEKRRDPDEHRRVVALFRRYLAGEIPAPKTGKSVPPALVARARLELRGKALACWCDPDRPDLACHADVWLELANAPAAGLDEVLAYAPR